MKMKILGAVSALAILVAITGYTEANAGATTAANADIGVAAEAKAGLKEGWEQTKATVSETTDGIKETTVETYESIKTKLIDEGAPADFTFQSRISAKGMLGQPIFNAAREKVGTVKDIILDADGNAKFVVVSDGGVMGIGDKLAAFDYGLVIRQETDGDVIMPLSEELLAKVDAFSYDPAEESDDVQVIPESGYSVAELLKGRVVNPKDEVLGNVENLTFRGGRAAQVIVSFEQKGDMDDARAALDFNDLTLAKAGDGMLNFRLNSNQSARFEQYKQTVTTN